MPDTAASTSRTSSPRRSDEFSLIAMNSRQPHPGPPGQHVFKGLPARRQSLRKLLLKTLSKWLLSAVLTACVYTIFYVYSAKPVLSKPEKRVFNALITGFLIAQALVVVSLMNSVVGDLRWWILSRRYRSLAKVEAILQARSLWSVIVMSFRSKRASLHAVALSWVLLALGVQIALASIGLCYSVENAEERARFVPGRVALPDLSTIVTTSVVQSSSSLGAQQYTANRLGTISWAYDTATTAEVPAPGTLWYSDDPLFFCDDASSACDYVFRDVNADTQGSRDKIFVAAWSARVARATTLCKGYPVIAGMNGTDLDITIRTPDDRNETVRLPVRGGPDQTTFFTNTTQACGSSCSIVSAFEAASPTSPDAWFYACNTTIGDVSNAAIPAHELGTSLKRLATSAIALQGYASASASGDPADLSLQSMVYPSESVFGASMNGSVSSMQYMISRFAIGVVGAAAMTVSPDAVVNGTTPVLGVRLNMEHAGIIHLILLATCVGLLAMGVIGSIFANKVAVPSEGVVAEAQVLRFMGEAMRQENDDDGQAPKHLWIYRAEPVGNGMFDLHMACSTLSQGKGKQHNGG